VDAGPLRKGADEPWDAHLLRRVITVYLVDFVKDDFHEAASVAFIDHMKGADCEREVYRNRIVNIAFFRNSISHSPPPSPAECALGISAVLEVVRLHGAPVSFIFQLEQSLEVMSMVRASLNTIDVELGPEAAFSVGVENMMRTFAGIVGAAIEANYVSRDPKDLKPTMPIEVGGKCSVCTILRNADLGKFGDGRKSQLMKTWTAYKSWKWIDVKASVDAIEMARHEISHNHFFDAARAIAVLDHMVLVIIRLDLYGTEVKSSFDNLRRLFEDTALNSSAAGICDAILKFKFSVQPESSVGEIRIPVYQYNPKKKTTPRELLVGRDTLIDEAAALLRESPHVRLVLHGESGAGKTVTAVAVAYEVLSRYPLQLLFQASTPLVLRGELARYARAHVAGLTEDADDEVLVNAARRRLAELSQCSGLLLVIDDVGTDLAGVLALLPEIQKGSPAGPVIITCHVRHRSNINRFKIKAVWNLT